MEQALERRPWLTPVILALLSVIFFGGALWTPGQVLAGEDIGALFVPWLTFAVDSVRQGTLPLWNPNQFSGYPFFANIQVALFYPPTWLFLFLPIPAGLVVNLIVHVWLGGWGMAQLVRWVGGSRAGALVAGLTFAFSGFTAVRVEAGHYGMVTTLAWTPWIVLAYWWAARRGRWEGATLAGVPWAMAILAGHVTSMLYVALILVGAAGYHVVAVKTGRPARRLWRAAWPLAVMVVAGAALAAVQLVPTAEFATLSTRLDADYEFAARFSMPVEHLLTLAIPDFFGQPSLTGYWGRGSYTETMYYVGILPLILALLVLRAPTLRRPAVFFTLLAGGGLLLALGVNGALFPPAYRLLPVFRLARAPARAGFLFVFGASALSGLAATHLADPATRLRMTRPLSARPVGAVVGGATLAAVIAFLLSALNLPGSEAGRLSHMGTALVQFAVWFALGAGLLIWWRRGTGRRRWVPLLAAGVALLDLWTFGARMVQVGSPPPPPMWETVRDLTAESYGEEGPFRVLTWGVPIFWQNGATMTADVESVFGYNAMELAAYSAFTSAVPDWQARAYDLLNARYVVSGAPLDTEDERSPLYVGESYGVYVYRRPDWLPRAWLAGSYEITPDPVGRVSQPDFDPRTIALLETAPPCAPEEGGGTTEIVEEAPDHVTLAAEAEGPALLIYSGQFYPGWMAAVDGEPAEVLRADAVLRAVCVPAGRHTITMTFWPGSLVLGGVITVGMAVMIGIAGWRYRRGGGQRQA